VSRRSAWCPSPGGKMDMFKDIWGNIWTSAGVNFAYTLNKHIHLSCIILYDINKLYDIMLYYNLFALWADWSRMDELEKMTSPQECGAICKFGASHQLQSCDTSPSHLVGKYHIFSHHQTKKGI
jgi:hypothetical protein